MRDTDNRKERVGGREGEREGEGKEGRERGVVEREGGKEREGERKRQSGRVLHAYAHEGEGYGHLTIVGMFECEAG